MTAEPLRDPGAAAVAKAFVAARLAAWATPDYPGVLPTSMAEGYAIQEIAISLYPNFGILMYPVATLADLVVHAGSREQLLGAAPSPGFRPKPTCSRKATTASASA